MWRGKSIWVTSPVTTTLLEKPMRVRNIFICSPVVFWASSRMMKASFSVRPRMKASGAISMTPLGQVRLELVLIEHVLQGVVQRAQVGIDLGLQVSGQEAQFFPGLHRRTGQDDALDRLGLQRLNGHGHGHVGLARPRRADAEGDVTASDLLQVQLLPRRLGLEAARQAQPRQLGLGGQAAALATHAGRSQQALGGQLTPTAHHVQRVADHAFGLFRPRPPRR